MSIRMQADNFFNAYQILRENEESLVSNLESLEGKPLEGVEGLGTRPTGGVSVVCLAFSVELYFKDLHYAVNGKAPNGHNILKLFEKLPENIRKEIFGHDSISQNPFAIRGNIFSTKRYNSDYSPYDGFIDQIRTISDSFTKWRYSYESTSLQYEIWFALALIESVKACTDNTRMRS